MIPDDYRGPALWRRSDGTDTPVEVIAGLDSNGQFLVTLPMGGPHHLYPRNLTEDPRYTRDPRHTPRAGDKVVLIGWEFEVILADDETVDYWRSAWNQPRELVTQTLHAWRANTCHRAFVKYVAPSPQESTP